MSNKPHRSHTGLIVILTILILAMIAATAFVVWLCIDMVHQKPDLSVKEDVSIVLTAPTEQPDDETVPTVETLPPETTLPPEPEKVIATASISSQGDLLMHSPVFESCRKDGGYDFTPLFQYIKDTVSSYDYALANLETTFGGPEHPHVANQSFSCPDQLASYAKEAGYDMFLTANNHSGDTMGDGLIRTIEVTREAGLANLGAQLPGEKPYAIVDINGIKVGMVAYTWAFSGDGSKFSLNGLLAIKDEGQMNYFTKVNPDKLYKEAEQIMTDMKADGAEVTMMQIHWGEEYQLTENALQNKIAQRLCDIGFDVIVGGHPHVVQPMELLTSTVDDSHKTVCIYSLGNAVSNQRTGVSSLFPPGYTEDGALFTVTFEKYSDGKVYLAETDVIPTWVNMHQNNGPKEYNILPLIKDQEDSWKESFKLTDHNFSSCQKSYDRTMGIVGEGLQQCQDYLAQAKTDREAYYLDLAQNPSKYAEAPAEVIPETIAEETVLPAA